MNRVQAGICMCGSAAFIRASASGQKREVRALRGGGGEATRVGSSRVAVH